MTFSHEAGLAGLGVGHFGARTGGLAGRTRCRRHRSLSPAQPLRSPCEHKRRKRRLHLIWCSLTLGLSTGGRGCADSFVCRQRALRSDRRERQSHGVSQKQNGRWTGDAIRDESPRTLCLREPHRITLVVLSGSRPVNLSSAGHRYADIDLEDPNFEHTHYEKLKAARRAA